MTVASRHQPNGPLPIRLVGRIALAAAVVGYNFGIIGPIVGGLEQRFDVTYAAIGLLAAFLSITHAASQLPAAVPMQRFGPLRVARIGLLVIFVANFIGMLAPVFWVLAASRIIVGLGTGPLVVGVLDGARRLGGARLAGIAGGATMLGLGLALLIGAVLDGFGAPWWSNFAVALLVAAAAALACPADRPQTQEPERERIMAQFGRVFRSGTLWRLAFLHTMTFGTCLVIGFWIVEYLNQSGSSKLMAGAIGFTLLGVSAVFRWTGGEAMDRGAPWLLVGPVATVIAAGAMFGFSRHPEPLLALPLALVVGAGLAAPFSGIFVFAVRAEPAAPAAAIAMVNMFATAMALIAAPVIGALFDAGRSELMFVGLALLAIVAAAVNLRPIHEVSASQ